MGVKEYELPKGRKAVFEFDENGVGKITLEAMDLLMGMVNIDLIRCRECKWWDKLKGGIWETIEGEYGFCTLKVDAYNHFGGDNFCSYAERANATQRTQCVESVGERRTDDSNKSTRRTYGGLQEM